MSEKKDYVKKWGSLTQNIRKEDGSYENKSVDGAVFFKEIPRKDGNGVVEIISVKLGNDYYEGILNEKMSDIDKEIFKRTRGMTEERKEKLLEALKK
jgi:hypothetical protein